MAIETTIIGGGVIGCSIAFHLARRGIGTRIIEAGGLAAGSSGACDGLIFLQSKKPGIHLELALAGAELFAELAGELPLDIEFRRTGGLVVIEDEAQMAAMETFVADRSRSGLDVRLLDGGQARRLEPALAESVLGATHSPADGQVNPINLTLGLAAAAREMGVDILTHERVTGLERSGPDWRVTTTRGNYAASIVINACGSLAPEVGRLAGLEIPIKPRRGQIVVTRALRPLISHCLLSAAYIAAKYNPELARTAGMGVSMEQTERGNLLLGSTREFVGYNRRTTTAGLATIARNCVRLIPALAGVGVLRTFAGLRPYTPDGLPLLGEVAGRPGLIMAAGHEGDGIGLSLITGRLIAQLVAEGRTEFDLSLCSPDRFTVSASGEAA